MDISYPVHVSPTGGTLIVDRLTRVVAIAQSWTQAAAIVEALNNMPRHEEYKPRTMDGLECVPWVKKFREENQVTLTMAKAEWDRRLSLL